MNQTGIYGLTIISAGKSYIGSSRNLKRRESNYKSWAQLPALIKSVHFTTDDIIFKIIETLSDNISDAKLKHKELFYMNKFNTFFPNGFNICNPVTGAKMNGFKQTLRPINPKHKHIDINSLPSLTELLIKDVPDRHIIYSKR